MVVFLAIIVFCLVFWKGFKAAIEFVFSIFVAALLWTCAVGPSDNVHATRSAQESSELGPCEKIAGYCEVEE